MKEESMLSVFEALIESGKLPVVDSFSIPSRKERYAPIPDAFSSGSVGSWLDNGPAKGRLWSHQALALSKIADGENVVISTGTASGKSLIFQAAALRLLEKDKEARIMVFYPLLALAADQMEKWKTAVRLLKLPKTTVARIDSSVEDYDDRLELMRKARIVVITPDSCHRWFMGNINNAALKDFLQKTNMFIFDEAHVYESLFGSNIAFLIRRLLFARRILCENGSSKKQAQIISASATIESPKEHLEKLTGCDFFQIEEKDNGAPRHGCKMYHIEHIVNRETGRTVMPSLVEESREGGFIAFRDSRQGVEKLTLALPEEVSPYRGGYEVEERTAIEKALRDGSRRGVVSTSALEVGVDIPHFVVGFNFDVPESKKAFRQRIGRVGRDSPGAFSIVAESSAFRKFGQTLQDYYESTVEPSYLYLNNRFMQFIHARCLINEIKMLDVSVEKSIKALLDATNWPAGFADMYACAGLPFSKCPEEFNYILKSEKDDPHKNYPIRYMGESLTVIETGNKLATITLQQAIREAFPGAVYLHNREGYKVNMWRNRVLQPRGKIGRSIYVFKTARKFSPKPIIETDVIVDLDQDNIIEQNLRGNSNGLIAECYVRVTERVIGYELGKKIFLYEDLCKEKKHMVPQKRNFQTTGVIIKIDEPWFNDENVKKNVAVALRSLFLREYSIAYRDVYGASKGINLIARGQQKEASNVIALYDAVHGGLRLTEPLFLYFREMIGKFEKAVSMDDKNCLLDRDTVRRISNWCDRLPDMNADAYDPNTSLGTHNSENSNGKMLVFNPGSVVTNRDRPEEPDLEIIEPVLKNAGSKSLLYYRCKRPDGKYTTTILAKMLEGVVGRWTHIYWDPLTGEYDE